MRFLLRTMGLLAFAAGFALVVADGARSIAASAFDALPLGRALELLTARQIATLEPAVSGSLHPFLWDPVLVNLMMLPASLWLFMAGAIVYRLGQPAADRLSSPSVM